MGMFMIAVSMLDSKDGVRYAEACSGKNGAWVKVESEEREPVEEWMDKWGYSPSPLNVLEENENTRVYAIGRS